jgi:hypothetical protein
VDKSQIAPEMRDISIKSDESMALGLNDRLPYEFMPDPFIMLTFYGAIGAMYEIEHSDTAYISDSERMQHAARVADTLTRTGQQSFGSSAWMMHTHFLCTKPEPLPQSTVYFSDGQRILAQAQADFMEERRARKRHFVSLTYMPPAEETQGKVEQWFIVGDKPKSQSYTKVKSDFLKGLEVFEESLRGASRKARRLGAHPDDQERNEFLEILYEMVNGKEQEMHVGHPFEPMFVSGMLAMSDMGPAGFAPMIGDKHLRVLSFFSFPKQTTPILMDAFAKVPGYGFRLATRSIFEDADKAKARLDFKRRSAKPFNLIMGMLSPKVVANAFVDGTKIEAERKAGDNITLAESGIVVFAHLSEQVVFLDENLERLDDNMKRVKRALRKFVVKEERANTIAAYLGHLPFVKDYNKREGQAHSINIARVFPTSSAWPGRKTWDCDMCKGPNVPALIGLTPTGEDFYIDPHDRQNQSLAGYGRPGAGKSSWLNSLATGYLREPNDQVFGIDKNYGQLVTCRFMGGRYVEDIRYWIFDGLDNDRTRDRLASFLIFVCEINGVDAGSAQGFIKALDLLRSRPFAHRTLSTFLNVLKSSASEEVIDVLGNYAHGGIHDGVFDGAPGDFVSSRYEVYELGSILGDTQKDVVAGPVLLWKLASFEERLPGHRTWMPIDEAWASLQSEMVAERIGHQIRTLRYRHGGIALFTHSIADVKNSAIGAIVNDACQTRILFANPDAETDDFRSFYVSNLQLDAPKIRAIKTAKLGRDFAFVTREGFGICSRPLSPVAAAIQGCTGKDAVDDARRRMRDHPDRWREKHLEHYLGPDHRAVKQLRSLRKSSTIPTRIETIKEAIFA